MDEAQHVNDLVVVAAQICRNVCDASAHENVRDVVTNGERSRLTVEILKLLLAREDATTRARPARSPGRSMAGSDSNKRAGGETTF